MIRIEYWQTSHETDGAWYWHLRNTRNGNIIADGGEGYASEGNVKRAINAFNKLLKTPVTVVKLP